jgi:hypothetical protein
VDLDKLVYFAASVFWRGALSGWRIGRGRPTRLSFGPYEEGLRRFLHGEAPFPEHVLLVISLSDKQNALNNRNMALPFGGGRSENGYHYECVVPGIMFLILVGSGIPASTDDVIIEGNRYICDALWRRRPGGSATLGYAGTTSSSKLFGLYGLLEGRLM